MEINELFGTLQQSIVSTWRKHLEAKSLEKHEVLDAYYKDMPELIDKLIEDWQGVHEKVEHYKNLLNIKEYSVTEYLEELRKICRDGKSLLDKDELNSDMDDIIGFIDQTLYKLKDLVKESKSLSEYLTESLNKYPRYELNVGKIHNNVLHLNFFDNYSDNRNDLFLTSEGLLYARNNYDFGNMIDVIKGLGLDGEEVTGITDPGSYGKQLGKDGIKLYKKLKPGNYQLVGDDYPFAKTYKIVKKPTTIISRGF